MSEKIYLIPVIPLRGLTILPGTTVHFDISRETSINAAEIAMAKGQKLFVVAQKDPQEDNPSFDSIYKVGTVVKVKQMNKLPEDVVRVMVEAEEKAEIISFDNVGSHYEAEVVVKEKQDDDLDDLKREAFKRELQDILKDYDSYSHEFSTKTLQTLLSIASLDELMTQVIRRIPLDYKLKQSFLEEDSTLERFIFISKFLRTENEINSIRGEIVEKVKMRLDKAQREHILREQMQVIREELGDDYMSEAEEMEEKIKNLNAEEYVKEKLLKELARYKNYGNNGVEGNVIKTYLDTMLEMPWNNYTEENPDLDNAQKILDRDHYGLDKVKERMIEFLAVRNLTKKDGNSPIVCLVGPPGTGKTSIAKSVAEALNKKYVRISLGGVDDESEIRGHRKTYVGAMPGRVAVGLKNCKSGNPLILFDEVDKLGRSMHGDPASALLEVMDSEQNFAFRDNYLEVPIDLSNVLFIATANNRDTIPEPLQDRMEIIEVSGYTSNEKYHIATEHLIKKQLEKHGLQKSQLNITGDAINAIIDYYTRESGVRQLEREIAKICRIAAKGIEKDGKKSMKVTDKNITKYLGRKKFDMEMANKKDDVGIVRGLAWTPVGGTTLQIEVNTMPGKGKLKITGQLGEVMQESAEIALTYVRSIASKYGVDKEFFAEHNIHIHVPEGAVPKDGPSAGITMATALLSAVANIKVDCKVAMTGEINLRGDVMPIGGVKEKLLAAKNAGIEKVLVPFKNKPEVQELDKEITDGLEVVFVKTMNQVLKNALKEK
ncbi:MAG: endopeptidase La [Eubacterium sp.]|nr:endopeptidase La [Eubacterium sp.]